jgi:hypothetical protein
VSVGRAAADAWTGHELVILGGQLEQDSGARRDGAAYDPATNTWRSVPAAPFIVNTSATMLRWGRDVVIAQTVESGTASFHRAAVYAPDTNAWSRLRDVPIASDSSAIIAATDDSLVLVRSDAGREALALRRGAHDWTRAAEPPDSSAEVAVGAPDSIVVVGIAGTADGGTHTELNAYDPRSDAWRLVSPGDGHDWQAYGSALAARSSIVLPGPAWHVVDRISGALRTLRPPPIDVRVAYPLGLIGDQLVGLAVQPDEQMAAPQIVAFRPDDPNAFGP